MQSTLKTFCIGLAAIGHLFVSSAGVAGEEDKGNVKKWEQVDSVVVAGGEKKGNVKKGEQLYVKKVCHTCHGKDAKKPLLPGYPKLAGQDETYIVRQTKAIRDGERTGDMTGTMKSFTIGLADEEIADIAAWIASLSACVKPVADDNKTDETDDN